ncbi:hypothetical protein NDA16_000019 [Ustilago loliicola]|nr:hypothetical protein NDA16_000019 [Ustilago loliicola]
MTAPSDYQFQAPLLSASCGASTIDPVSEELEEANGMLNQAGDSKRREEVGALLKKQKQMKREAKKEAKREAKREQRRAERQQPRDAAAAASAAAESQAVIPSAVPIKEAAPEQKVKQRAVSAASASLLNSQPRAPIKQAIEGADAEAIIAQQLAVRRTIMKQRSISLGMARSQFAATDADRYANVDDVNVPDSPWTSSDSDISVRRWGEPRRDDSLRYQNRTSRHHYSSSIPSVVLQSAAQSKRSASKNARVYSYYYGMGAGSDLRDLC